MLTWGGAEGQGSGSPLWPPPDCCSTAPTFQRGGWARERGGEAGPNTPQKNFLKVREGYVKVP